MLSNLQDWTSLFVDFGDLSLFLDLVFKFVFFELLKVKNLGYRVLI